MNVEIGAEAALFPEKECINGIFVAVYKLSFGDEVINLPNVKAQTPNVQYVP